MSPLRSTAAIALALVATAALATEATRWTPPALTSDEYESSPTFVPDGSEMMFFRGNARFTHYRLLQSRCIDGRWSAPTPPAFAAPADIDEADPAFSADGRRLYFVSTRGDGRRRNSADLDIWVVERGVDGSWASPSRLPEPVNSTGEELLPRPQPDGTLVFGSDRAGGLGGNDIYVARPAADGWRVENLGAPVNTPSNEYEAEISRDGRLMIVVADRGDRSHLYPYRREAGAWVPMPRIVPKHEVFQVGPLLSPRADRLLFAQADGARSGELFLLDLVPEPDRAWPPDCAR